MSAEPLATAPPTAGRLASSIGDTPLIELGPALEGQVGAGVRVLVKAEWLNPGGSVKDRAALSMLDRAAADGRLRPGGVVLDASSGNTGIALAMLSAARGYRLVICLPRNASVERQRLLKAYGARIEYTSPLEGSDGAIRRARELAALNTDWVYLDQYGNEANWQAHFRGTGPEIWRQTAGSITHFVSCLGTSGTMMGVGRYLRSQSGRVQLVAVQPDSPFHGIEGLKHMETALVPAIYDPGLPDMQLGAPTERAYEWCRRLAMLEGLLLGPSAAAAVWAAVEVGASLDHGVIVTIGRDGENRYLSESHFLESAC